MGCMGELAKFLDALVCELPDMWGCEYTDVVGEQATVIGSEQVVRNLMPYLPGPKALMRLTISSVEVVQIFDT